MNIQEIATWVGIAASSALVVSVCLLAYNLRASRIDARRNLAFSMMEQLTSAEFAERRWKMHTSVAAGVAAGWNGFDNTLEDFESRAFAYQYELIGQMVVADWNAFHPLDAHLQERFPGRGSPWARFRSLAIRVTNDLNGPPIQGLASPGPSGPSSATGPE